MRRRVVTRANLVDGLPDGRLQPPTCRRREVRLVRAVLVASVLSLVLCLVAALRRHPLVEPAVAILWMVVSVLLLYASAVASTLHPGDDWRALQRRVRAVDAKGLLLTGWWARHVPWEEITEMDWPAEGQALVRWRGGSFMLDLSDPQQERLRLVIDRLLQARQLGVLDLDAEGEADDHSLSRVRLTDSDSADRGLSQTSGKDEG